MKKAFSLIEILMGLGLFAVLGTVSSVMLLSAMRGARKAEAINIAKNEGQYALTAISQMTRFAKGSLCGGTTLRLTRTDDSFVNYSLSSGTIASDSGNLTSGKVTVTVPASPTCPAGSMFTCSGRNVQICFNIDTANTTDVTETAGILFNTTVVLRNYGI